MDCLGNRHPQSRPPPGGQGRAVHSGKLPARFLDIRAEYLNRDVGVLDPIFPEPEALLTSSPRLPGTDGRKMSKSYANAIFLTDAPEVVSKKLATMVTDPARKRRTRPRRSGRLPGV